MPLAAPEGLLPKETPEQRRVYNSVVATIEFMRQQGLNLSTFLGVIVGIDNPSGLHGRLVSNTRSELYKSSMLLRTVKRWLCHPNSSGGPKRVLRPMVFGTVRLVLEKELKNVDKALSKSPVTHEALLSFDFDEFSEWLQSPEGAPNLFEMLYLLASTERRRKENVKKNPKMVRLFLPLRYLGS